MLLVALVVSVVVIGTVSLAWRSAEDRWLGSTVPRFFHQKLFQDIYILNLAYDPDVSDGVEVVRGVLDVGPEKFSRYFRDMLVSNGPSPEARGSVDLNPMGAAHRDPHTFPLEAIREGIRQAMDSEDSVPVAGGFCIPIRNDQGVVGGTWFVPKVPTPPGLPVLEYALPILVGAGLLGIALFWVLNRSVVRPLRNLGDAAASVGARQVGVRVPELAGGPELKSFIDAFNEMAERVEGHREELEREVAHATETAEKRQTAMLRSARLASMGTLAAGIAHEINNPIGGMINAIRRIGSSEHLSERDRRYVDLIQEGLERVSRIARRVLDFSPKQLEAVAFSLSNAIEGARGLADHRFQRQGVELRLDVPSDLPALVGDEHEFQQVLLNLFLNSLDVLEDHPDAPWIEVRARAESGWMTIDVVDNGPGMDEDKLPRVMDPFFSAKGRPDSSGLGMFISHQIIENHGGSLEVESKPGEGFRVIIRMPIESA